MTYPIAKASVERHESAARLCTDGRAPARRGKPDVQSDCHYSTSVPGPPVNLSRTNPWLVFLLPLAVYMLVGSFEPAPPAPGARPAEAMFFHLAYPYYPLIYALKIALTAAAIAYVWPGYRQFQLRISWLAIGVGAAGVVVWIGLADAERFMVAHAPAWLRDWGQRSGYNPLTELAPRPALAYGFLALRLFGLAVIVPLIEEFFLRGFVMRFVVANKWWTVPFGQVNRLAIVAGTLVPVLMHPASGMADRRRLVFRRHLADAAHAQHLGLRGGPCRDEPVAGGLRLRERRLATTLNASFPFARTMGLFGPPFPISWDQWCNRNDGSKTGKIRHVVGQQLANAISLHGRHNVSVMHLLAAYWHLLEQI